jgi:signal transduction histidine kinase
VAEVQLPTVNYQLSIINYPQHLSIFSEQNSSSPKNKRKILTDIKPCGIKNMSLSAERNSDSVQEMNHASYWTHIQPAGFAVFVILAYYLGAKIGFNLTFKPHVVSTLWPPNAILFAVLVLTSWQMWPVALLGAFLAHLIVELQTGVPMQMVLCWFISNSFQAFLGAILIRRLVGDKLRFDSSRHVIIFIIFAAAVAPFAASFLDAAFVALNQLGTDDFWKVWRMRFFSNVLAILIIAPVFVMLGANGIAYLRSITLRRLFEGFLMAAGLFLACIIAFGAKGVEPGNVPVLVYSLLPFLLWAAARFGPAGLSLALLITTLMSIWSANNGLGPFTSVSVGEKVLFLQLFLIIMAMPLMFLAAAIREQENAERTLRKSEERYRVMVEEQADLAGRLIIAQEEERKRLNRALHEDLNQQVAALAIGLGRLGRQLHDGDHAVRNEITKLETRTTLLSERVSSLSHELHSSTLEHVGLAAALKLLCIEFTDRENVSVTLAVKGAFNDVPAEIALCLYRVAQESLRNIAEHSGAKSAHLILTETADALELRIADQGVGFDPIKAKERRGLGLISIEERIKLSHGSFEIESHPGSGTELKVSIPFRKES